MSTTIKAAGEVSREDMIALLARVFPQTFTTFGDMKTPNALAFNVASTVLLRLSAPAGNDGVRLPAIAPGKCFCCGGDLHLNGANYVCDRGSSTSYHTDDLSLPQAREAEPVAWPNNSNESVPLALRYLAEHARPAGGQEAFNSEHLHQLAGEIERMASRPLYASPPPIPDAAVGPADQIIGQIEARFPDWKSFRDLVDCIDVTLHRLRGGR